MKNDFCKMLMKDWGKEDIYGPWTVIDKNNTKIPYYKSYYLITTNKSPNIDILPK